MYQQMTYGPIVTAELEPTVKYYMISHVTTDKDRKLIIAFERKERNTRTIFS